MQGGQGPGRNIYAVRRLVAALVILLLLILLIPWACQALLGSGNESGSGASDTADVNSSGRSDEGAVETEATTETNEQGSATEESSSEEEVSSGGGARETSDEAEYSEAQNAESEVDLALANVELDAAVGESGPDQTAPVPVVDLANQQPIQPIAPEGQIAVEQPLAAEPPVIPEQPVISEPVFLAQPILGDPYFLGSQYASEDQYFFEDQTIPFGGISAFYDYSSVLQTGYPATLGTPTDSQTAQESTDNAPGDSGASAVAIASSGNGKSHR
jgi:hypothetical protein